MLKHVLASVGNDILGFNMDGNVVNNPNPHSGELHWPTVCSEAAKVCFCIK